MARYPEQGLSAVLDLSNWSSNVVSYLRDITRMDRAEDAGAKTSEKATKARDKMGRYIKESGDKARKAGQDMDRLSNDTEQVAKSADKTTRSISRFTEGLISLDAGIRVMRTGVQAATGLAGAVESLAGRASQVQTVGTAFGRITSGIGEQNDLITLWRSQSSGMISDLELMRQGNIALINTSEETADVIGNSFGTVVRAAMAGAASTGQDFNYILEKAVRGIRRMSNPLLDDIGVWVDATTAQQRYAEAQNITVASMTEAQKAAAWQAEAIRQMSAIIDQSGDIMISWSSQAAASWDNTLNSLSLDIQAGARDAEHGFALISMAAAGMVDEASPYLGAFADVFGEIILHIGDETNTLLAGLNPQAFFEGGANIIVALGEGMLQGLTFVIRVVNIIAQTVADFLMGFSPPKLGPLSTIDEGGKNVVEAWVGAFDKVSTAPVQDFAGNIRDILMGISDLEAGDQAQVLEMVQARLQDRLNQAVAALSQGANNADEVRMLDQQRVALADQIQMLKEKAALEKLGLKYTEDTVKVEEKAKTTIPSTSTGRELKGPKGGASPIALPDAAAGVPSLVDPYFFGGTGTSGPREQGDAGFQSTQEGFANTLRTKFGELEDEYNGFITEIGNLKATFDQINPFEAISNFLDDVQNIDSFSEFVDLFGRFTSLPSDLITNLILGLTDFFGISPDPGTQRLLETLGDWAGKALLLWGAVSAMQGLAGALSAIKIAATANPVGLLVVAIAGLLAVINEFGPDALNTLDNLAAVLRVGMDNIKTEVEKTVDDVRLFFLTKIKELDDTLETVGIDLVPDFQIDQDIAEIEARQAARDMRGTVEEQVALVMSGETNRISVNARTAVDLSDVAVSQRARETVRVALEQAINSGDEDRIRILAQTAVDLDMQLPPNVPQDIADEVQSAISNAGPASIYIPLDVQFGINEATGAGFDVFDFNDPVFQNSVNGGSNQGDRTRAGGGIGGFGAGQLAGGRDLATGDVSGLLAVVQNKYQSEVAGQVATFRESVAADMEAAGGSVADFALAAGEDLILVLDTLDQTDQTVLTLTSDLAIFTTGVDAWTRSLSAAEEGLLDLVEQFGSYKLDINRATELTEAFADSLWDIPEGLARLDVHYAWTVPYGGARAGGGEVKPGYGYLVGEHGPEWFAPDVIGQIIPNNQIAPPPVVNHILVQPAPVQVGGGMDITNHFGQVNETTVIREMAELQALGRR